MAGRRPLVAVVGRLLPKARITGWRYDAVAIGRTYVDALHRAGAQEAVLLPVELDFDDAAEVLERFDGLVLTGGGDLDPGRYGATPHPETGGVDSVSDAFELSMAAAALESGMHVLAICRGMQVLNAVCGGTLHQHIPDRPDARDHGGKGVIAERLVSVAPDSCLHELVGQTELRCACHHHQAVDRLGEGLRPVGWSEDGLIEAVELPGRWVVGVQWHPEVTAADDPSQQRLFDRFVEAITVTAPRTAD